MSDRLIVEMDASELVAAIARLGTVAETLVRDAAFETANRIDAEATSRLNRQLGPGASGKTAAGIAVRPDFSGKGFIVVSERDPFANLPIWLEKGTKRGGGTHANVARPYFYVSAFLEEGAHLRRVTEAVSAALQETGLGE